ncbi:MAG: EVE domain-containing protein [Verrucomicrobia bacterium]|nr:EVE domain-containing protein [Verrucomicrobiota bacterium]
MKSRSPTSSTRLWLVKSEPEAYSWQDLVRDGSTAWTGVRNYAARLHLNAMQPGDRVLFYESVTTRAVVGLARVSRAAFPDPTAREPGWVAVQLDADRPLPQPVTLEQIKADPALAKMSLVRISRLSVHPVTPQEFARIERLASAR